MGLPGGFGVAAGASAVLFFAALAALPHAPSAVLFEAALLLYLAGISLGAFALAAAWPQRRALSGLDRLGVGLSVAAIAVLALFAVLVEAGALHS